MISKIESYLDNIDKNKLVVFYVFATLLLGGIYYSFNYLILEKKIKDYNDKIEYLKEKITDNLSFYLKLKQLEKTIKKLQSQNYSLKEDIKYLNILIHTSEIFNLNEKRFFKILKEILQKAVNNNITASYKIEVSANKFKICSIYINGKFDKSNTFNFFNFLKDLESIKNIKRVKNLSIIKKDDVIKFSLRIDFWSIL